MTEIGSPAEPGLRGEPSQATHPVEVEVVGSPVDYSDGSEAALAEIVRDASDRSSGSDELAAEIRDWPTRYHLAPERGHLLEPVVELLGGVAGRRVLDAGAGTGVLTRLLAEHGAEVVALEGNPDRARIAAERCSGLPGVRVLVGQLGDLDPETEPSFDVVLVCGVLEYADADIGGAPGAAAFLGRVRELLGPGGVLVLAIENQFGLKYLAGWPEDHHGRPWVGLAGYPGPPGPRTWSRRTLTGMLSDAGFPGQVWLHPFPDYKLPTAVLAGGAYELPSADRFVDQIVPEPVVDYAFPPPGLVDERQVHRELVRAGLGPEISNSFLVVASGEGEPDAVAPGSDAPVLAWSFDRGRLRRWRRVRRVVTGATGLEVLSVPVDPAAAREEGWLRQVVVARQAWVDGPNLEQEVWEACAAHDTDRVGDVLGAWRARLRESAERVEGGVDARSPFIGRTTQSRLPAHLLDTDLGNFVRSTGGLVHVDAEWEADGGVDTDLVALRALRQVAAKLVASGAAHPWGDDITVDDLTVELARRCGVPADPGSISRWCAAEAQFQSLVLGKPVAALEDQLLRTGALVRPRPGSAGGTQSAGSDGPTALSAAAHAAPAVPGAPGARSSVPRRIARRIRSQLRRRKV